MPDFEVHETMQIERLAESGKTLVFLYFKGHGEVSEDGCVAGIDQFRDKIKLETFLHNVSAIERVHAIGIFDCCR